MHENDKGTKRKPTDQEVTAGWITKGYPVGSGSLEETFWKRTINNGALMEGLK